VVAGERQANTLRFGVLTAMTMGCESVESGRKFTTSTRLHNVKSHMAVLFAVTRHRSPLTRLSKWASIISGVLMCVRTGGNVAPLPSEIIKTVCDLWAKPTTVAAHIVFDCLKTGITDLNHSGCMHGVYHNSTSINRMTEDLYKM
jgi:hypothetical protein